MMIKKSEYVKRFTVGANDDTVKAIQKSGQSAHDWFRQAARNRIDGERQAETPTGKLEKQVDGLQKEIARLQQSEAVAHATLAEMRKTLAAIQQNQVAAQQNQVEFRRSLDQINAGFGHAFGALGQSLLVALGQQLRELVKAHEEPPKKPLPPPLPRTRL